MRPLYSVMLVFVLVLAAGFELSPAVAQPNLAGASTIVSISPSNFASGINQPVTITGTNLSDVSAALLGTTSLRNVHVTSATQVTALVPWSIAAGTYDLTVQSQGGPDAVLPGAVTVSPPDPDWTSNGPYGGNLNDVVVDPQDPSRMYVSAGFSGLYKSQNGGASWDFPLIGTFPDRVQITYPTPGQPPVMYFSGGVGQGVVRSLDYGQTWVKIQPSNIPGTPRVFVRPGHPNWVYLGVINAGLYKSTDQGDTWDFVSGTSGLSVKAVAFDPDHPDLNMVIGTASGQVYITTDDGLTWSNPITFPNPVGELYFAPKTYNGRRSLFAIPCNVQWNLCSDNDTSYQSTDGGLTWTPLTVASSYHNDNGLAHGLAFHESIPGLMWAAVGNGHYSEDGGTTWHPVGAGLDTVKSFAVVPGASSRQTTTLFAATRSGLYKSTDGGDTWQETDTGIGAVLPGAIVISPFNADEAYAETQAKGLLHTFDGGRHWQSLPTPAGAQIEALDPFVDGKAYFGGGPNSSVPPSVWVSSDHGSTFTEYALTLPPEYAGQPADGGSILPDPQVPNRLLAGVCLGGNIVDGQYVYGPGLIYASTGGATWTQQATPAGIKCIDQLVFDPQDADVVYAGSSGSGLLRSTDRGATWNLLEHQPTGTNLRALAIDPGDSNSIYAEAGDNVNGGLYATHDGGDTWVNMSGTNGWVWRGLKFVKVGAGNWLYAVTMSGLHYLKTVPDDPNVQWETASGIAGVAVGTGFNAATEDDGRIVYYVGTSGGTRLSAQAAQPAFLPQSAAPQNFTGGIYRTMALSSLFGTPGWQLKNQSEIGNLSNRIMALEAFNGQLYAAASNWGGGGRVWRLSDGNNWNPVSQVGMSATYGSSNPAITDLVAFGGQLYASVGWGANEGQIWRTSKGTDWAKVTGAEFGGTDHRTVTVMAVFKNFLYACASDGSGPGGEIWRSSTGNVGSWQRVAQNGFGNLYNSYATGAATFNGALYVSLGNNVDGISVWSTLKGTDWTPVDTSSFGNADTTTNGGIAALGGYLYVGMSNTKTGGQIWRYDGAKWSEVVGDGFGNVNNSEIQSVYTVGNWLFAVTFNASTGLQVWMTANGTDWTALSLNGLGDSNNNGVFFSNSSTALGDRFVVAVTNSGYGDQIWQYVGYPAYLPMVRR